MLIAGLDVGGTATKAVLITESGIKGFADVSASDSVSSAMGALGKLILESGVGVNELSSIALTGGGANRLPDRLLGVKAEKIDEIEAIGVGGCFLSGRDRAAVVSIGTGTAVVGAWGEGACMRVEHLGGTAVGGGTLAGLGRLLLGKSSVDSVLEMAREGDLARVDLTVGDIVGRGVGMLPPDATASNFGKVGDWTRPVDVAAGIVNLVGQVVGTVAVLAARAAGLEDSIVLVGRLAEEEPVAKTVIHTVELFGGRAMVPENATYATAIGAARRLLTRVTFPSGPG
ncbi:MAG: pantothenate kinase [Thermoproteota archaeon]|nr:MAG: pantothenate kinase [Candidatus Korarchaeota archaeon]